MAAAQILRLTHAIDGKVNSVENKMKGVGDKMDAVIKGTRSMALIHPILIARVLVRGTGRKGDFRRQEMSVISLLLGSSNSNPFLQTPS
jgi:hypothetical protein